MGCWVKNPYSCNKLGLLKINSPSGPERSPRAAHARTKTPIILLNPKSLAKGTRARGAPLLLRVLDAAARGSSKPAETAIMWPWIPTTAQSRASAAPAAMSVVGILAHFALDAVRVATRSNAHPTRPVGAGGTVGPSLEPVLVWAARTWRLRAAKTDILAARLLSPPGTPRDSVAARPGGQYGLPTYAVAPANVAFRPSLAAL